MAPSSASTAVASFLSDSPNISSWRSAGTIQLLKPAYRPARARFALLRTPETSLLAVALWKGFR